MSALDAALETRRILLCVGSGGVGKTTAAAALGLAGARRGRRAAVLTIDPARRLKDALGIKALDGEPHRVPLERLKERPSGTLDAMLLDAKRTFDGLIRRYAPSDAAAERVLANRIYQSVSTTLAAHESVSSATSHEAVELQCDIFCASWSYSNRLHCLVATEACDPVQSDTYTIPTGGGAVEVSNFVTPYYFTEDALGAPLDHLGTVKETFGIAKGGYQIRMKGGAVTNVFGEGFSDDVRAGKEAGHGRTFWRHVTMALAMAPE